jgi:flagellar motor switch protein FliN/FliY
MNSSISQEEIEALFGGAPKPDANAPLTAEEIDALGELGNICMGNAATTLGEILSRRVRITTPRVRVINLKELAAQYQVPFVVVEVRYTEGLEGNNVLILKKEDVMLITDLMVGGEGKVSEGELGELQLSAISETMNQMMGSSATSMSDMLGKTINISPPKCTAALLGGDKMMEIFSDTGDIIQVSFSLEIEGLANSEFMQLMPVWFGRALVNALLNKGAPGKEGKAEAEAEPGDGAKAESGGAGDGPAPAEEAQAAQEDSQTPEPAAPEEKAAPAAKPAPEAKPAPAAEAPAQQKAAAQPRAETYVSPQAPSKQPVVDARPMRYASFDEEEGEAGAGEESIGIIIDVPLQVTIELGKCRKTVKEILEFNIGTILVLEKLAGEPVEIVVNEKLIARGEVIQIDDNYGVRITEILSKAGKAG